MRRISPGIEVNFVRVFRHGREASAAVISVEEHRYGPDRSVRSFHARRHGHCIIRSRCRRLLHRIVRRRQLDVDAFAFEYGGAPAVIAGCPVSSPCGSSAQACVSARIVPVCG